MAREMTSYHCRLLLIMQPRIGRENAIKGRRLAKMMKVGERTVRSLVNDLMKGWGIPIIGDTSAGYYLVGAIEEIEAVTATLKKHALHELWKAALIKKIAPADLIGQLTFEWPDMIGVDMPGLEDGDETLPPHLVAITAMLGRYQESPEEYADEIRALQQQFSPLFVSREDVAELQQAEATIKKILSRIA